MPNWVSTTMEVIGSESEVRRFAEGIKDREIIKSYLPVPKELEIKSTNAFDPNQIPPTWQEWVTDGSWTQQQYDERVAENNALFEAQQSNIAKHGCKDWYDWQYSQWGTKWGDCDTDIQPIGQRNDGRYALFTTFQTPWGPAHMAWEKISAMFPTLLFTFDYDEEAGFFAGSQVFMNGESVFEAIYEPCTYAEEVDWDDYESIDKYEAWKTERGDKIAEELISFMNELWETATPLG